MRSGGVGASVLRAAVENAFLIHGVTTGLHLKQSPLKCPSSFVVPHFRCSSSQKGRRARPPSWLERRATRTAVCSPRAGRADSPHSFVFRVGAAVEPGAPVAPRLGPLRPSSRSPPPAPRSSSLFWTPGRTFPHLSLVLPFGEASLFGV